MFKATKEYLSIISTGKVYMKWKMGFIGKYFGFLHIRVTENKKF
jgi:hypothetical protein